MSKVAYFAPYFWPEMIGSAPYCTDVARWLRQGGHEVEVVAFRPHYPDPEDFSDWALGARDHETYDGMRISRIGVGARGNGGVLTRLKNDLRYFVGTLRASFRQDLSDVDAVVAYVPSSLALLSAMVLSWRADARFTGVVHDIESGLAVSLGMAQKPMLLWLMRRVEQLAFNRADQLIVLSTAMEKELRDLGCDRPITALPIWSSTFPDQPIDDQSVPAICYSGNFGKKQNLDLLLPLIRMLSERRPEVRVILRGDGTERERIQQQVEAMHAANTVFLPLAPYTWFPRPTTPVTTRFRPRSSASWRRDARSCASPRKAAPWSCLRSRQARGSACLPMTTRHCSRRSNVS
jgi:colanic acid biosynthesis glycosyl transferase WcaI